MRIRLELVLISAGLLAAAPACALAATPQPRVMYDSQQSPAGLWTANLDGSNPQSFHPGGFWSSWSANGAKLAFTTDSGPCQFGSGVGQIYVMNADGSNLTAIAQGCEPRISPDGTKVVYQPEANAVDVMNANGQGQPVELVNFNVPHSNSGCDNQPNPISGEDLLADCYSAENPGWLGNNTVIYDGGLGLALWQVPSAGGPAAEVSGTDQATSGVAWLNGVTGSYDGSTWAATGSKCGSSTCVSGLFVGNAEVVTDPTAGTLTLADPQWSYDDQKIIYETSQNTGATSVYRTPAGGGTQTLLSGTDTTAANPSFAPPASPGTITGTVLGPDDKTPLPGVTVTITPTGGGAPITTTTLSDGSFAASVSPTTYAVTPSGTPPGQQPGGHYHVTACSGTTSLDTATCSVDVAPGGPPSIAKFTYGALQLTGTVTFAGTQGSNGQPDPVQGMNVTVTGPGTNATVQTDQNGNYTVNLTQAGAYTVSADPQYQPTAVTSADCQASGGTCTVNLNQDRVANFTVQCLPTLDFHTSMIAAGCFQPVDLSAGKWKAKGQFRMDGIDFESPDDSSAPVIFNSQAKTVDGSQVKMSLSAPGWGGGWLAFYVPGGLHLSFPFTSEQHTWALTTPWATPGNLAAKGVGFLAAPFGGSSTIFGFPAHAPAVELDFTPGQTSLQLQLSFPTQNNAYLDPINGLWKVRTANGGSRITYPIAVRSKIVAENKDGVSEIDGSFSPSAAYGINTQNNTFVREAGAPALGTVELARMGFSWLLAAGGFDATALLVVHNTPSDAAKAWVKPLAGFLGKTLVSVDLGFKWLTTVSLFGRHWPVPGLTRISVNVNNINEYIEGTPGLFWQRVGFTGGVDPTNPTGAFALGGSVGFTWLPRFKSDFLWFQEILSLDAGGTFTFDPFSFGGNAALKALNATLISGTMKLNHDGLNLTGTAGFNLNQLLRVGFPASIQGTGSLSLPTTGDTFLGNWLMQIDGKINVWNLVADAKFAMNADGAAWCATSNKLGTAGAYFDGAWHVGGCNSGPLGSARSAGARSSLRTGGTADAAAATREATFTLGRHAHVSEVAIRGAGAAPQVAVTGPGGLSLSVTTAAPYDISSGAGLVMNPSDHTTYLLLARPARGRYSVTPLAGSATVAGLRFARRLAPVRVGVRVATAGCRRVLSWRLRPEPGQRVSFYASGRGGDEALLTTAAAHGRRVFTPHYGDGSQQVVALVLQQGTPRARVVLARFRAPSGIGRVARLRARRTGSKVTLRWAPVCGASSYIVTVGRGKSATTAQSLRAVANVAVGKSHHVRIAVQAVNPDGQAGRATSIVVD